MTKEATTADRWQQVAEVYLAAVERDPADRYGFLREACEGDEGLRREVESLLGYEGATDPWIERPAAALAAPMLDNSASPSWLTGRQIGPYTIVSLLDSGGMGEVYRARDTTLGRDVAIKILPPEFTADADRRARFAREARLLAALNHPHIGAIYGLEEAEGVTALVLELVDGPTLADRIAQGPIPVTEALVIAKQIAEALEAAHEQGIIHRDLKPANVKVREDGTVKVLDFGLAKALGPEHAAASVDAMNSPALTAQATQLGIILGTAAYIAPEQAKGKPVDRRADIWAFGVVLYEMLTGQRGYDAEDVSGTLAAVLTRDVNWKALPTDVPPRLLALLRDCLVRDPKQRLRDIGEARRVLDQIIAGVPDPAAVLASAPSQPRPSGARALPWSVAAVALAGAAALTFVHFRETPPQQRVRFQVPAPEKSSIGGFALSPDGRYLAFATVGNSGSGVSVGATSKLWLRPIDSLDGRAVPGTEGTAVGQDQVFWSPDSEFIGFVTQDGKLKKVSVNGGAPQTLVSGVTPITRGAWGRDGTILFVRFSGAPIQRVPDVGGPVVDVTKKMGGESLSLPQFLPDGRHVLYSVGGVSAEANGIYVASLEDDAPAKRLLPVMFAKYVPSEVPGRSGHLLFLRDRTLMARPVDANTFTVTDQNLPVAESVGRFSISQNGALAYMDGRPARQELLWVDRSGRPLGVAAPAAAYHSVRLSPDEKSIAFTRPGEASRDDVWVLDLVRGVPTRITSDPAMDYLAEWSHDGRRIVWASRRSGTYDLYTKAASGTGQDERLITMGTVIGWATDWSPDGKFVLYQRPGAKTGLDLWIAPQSTGASGEPQTPFPYLDSPFDENDGVFSPDGHWIAYESNESGRPEVYVRDFPLTNQKVQISTGGGTDAAWSKNGGELFYLAAADRNLMAVPYRATATTFEPGVGKALFPLPGNLERRGYAVTGDGRRFLIGKPVESISEPITMVLNWLDERKQPVPSK